MSGRKRVGMFYQSSHMNLECVRTIFQGTVNDIYICKDRNTGGDIPYTLLVIKDHKITKKYLEIFEMGTNTSRSSYIDSFSDQGKFCMVFPYLQERYLKDFYMGNSFSLQKSEEICIQLILKCMETTLPYPILYLVLEQNQIHLAADNSVFWGYALNLEDLDSQKTEKDCVLLCAKILKQLLQSKQSSKGFAYRVLEKKIQRESYHHFVEVYKDFRITATPVKEKGIWKKVQRWFRKHQEQITRIFFFLCVIIVITAAFSLISQLIFGDIPWLRILFNGFKEIGTESLER